MQRRPALVAALLAVVLAVAGCAAGRGQRQSAAAGQQRAQTGHQHGAAPADAPVAPRDGVLAIRVDELPAQATEFLWRPRSLLLQTGRPVTFRINNRDYMQHNFTFKAAKVAANLPVDKTTTIRFSAPAPGTYRFYCKYHLQMMEGAITVR